MKDKIKFIEELAKSMNENKIEAVKYEDSNFEISLTKKRKERNIVLGGALSQPQPLVQPAAAENIQEEAETPETAAPAEQKEVAPEEISGTKITSPMVGTFYTSPSPTAAPFVKEGQTLCIVEAMKLMNEVKSTVTGKIKKVLVKDKDSIKKGQALFIVE